MTVTINSLISGLLITMSLTNIVIEILKIKTKLTEKYSSTLIALILSFVIGIFCSLSFFVLYQVPIGLVEVLDSIILSWASFFGVTIGYDKTKQLILEIKEKADAVKDTMR